MALIKPKKDPKEAMNIRAIGNVRHPEDGMYISLETGGMEVAFVKLTEERARSLAHDILIWLGDGIPKYSEVTDDRTAKYGDAYSDEDSEEGWYD